MSSELGDGTRIEIARRWSHRQFPLLVIDNRDWRISDPGQGIDLELSINGRAWRALAFGYGSQIGISISSTAFLEALRSGETLQVLQYGSEVASIDIRSISEEISNTIECISPHIPNLDQENAFDKEHSIVGNRSRGPFEKDFLDWLPARSMTPTIRSALLALGSFKIHVDESGQGTGCTSASSGEELDSSICRFILDGTWFTPARDRYGRPTLGRELIKGIPKAV